ncbi:PIR Superfamily Protein [Plasmodium ovale wallikeri]|uniref:PIR Superfamily Protein n=1 Tax=Plasmodium ovale wallikeri TaxID=864142 RepID=A0A1A9AR06_PLAOA|nr:PIR Superfamily Protein [Plasmodium ovale wallikeri]
MLLNYWIYDKLNNILGDKGIADVAFGSLQLPWNYTMNNRSNITYSNKCKDNFEILNHVDWKKRKELYDYYVDVETLVSTANNFVDQCKYYYEYIDKKTELYKHFEDLCSTEQNKCPISLEEYKQYNPNMVLSKLPCHDEMVRKKATAQPQALQQEAEPGPRSLGSDMPRHADGSDTAHTQENSDIGTKVGHSVLGVAPVLLTATALYRYTPLGPWFLKLSGGSPNSISDMEGFSSYTKESGQIFSDNAENYISYQPI